MDSLAVDYVGCLSQFDIRDNYSGKGVESKLFTESCNLRTL